MACCLGSFVAYADLWHWIGTVTGTVSCGVAGGSSLL